VDRHGADADSALRRASGGGRARRGGTGLRFNSHAERIVRLKVPGGLGSETESQMTNATNATLVQAPHWMFVNFGDTDGWMATEPRPAAVFHFMGQRVKARMMRAYGMWSWDELGIGAGRRTREVRFLSVGNADMKFRTRGEFTRQLMRLAALAAASNHVPVLPMLPCNSGWLDDFQCGDGECYAGISDRSNVLTARCPVTAERQLRPAGASDPGAVGTPCCYFIPPGVSCTEEYAAWGMEMTPPDADAGAKRRPELTVAVGDLVAAARVSPPPSPGSPAGGGVWTANDGADDGAAGPHDVALASAAVRRELAGAAGAASPGWVEIDLGGSGVLPRAVGGGGDGGRNRPVQGGRYGAEEVRELHLEVSRRKRFFLPALKTSPASPALNLKKKIHIAEVQPGLNQVGSRRGPRLARPLANEGF
jgi:hypothetical protein